MLSLLGLDPAGYVPHGLHASERMFPETNCYTDIWIELVHASGHEPLAMLGFCTAVDFEGDQWTFFKPPPADLERLYGLEVYELALYRPLPEHCVTQLELGRAVIVEVDGHFLPDTAGRSYRATHEKTSIVVEAIDTAARRLRYFHNAGYYELTGDDYSGALRLGGLPEADLPPYVEIVRRDRLEPCAPDAVKQVAGELLAEHLGRRPRTNPVTRFGDSLGRDLPTLSGEDAYHAYAFATLRQCGAAWDAAATFLRWLEPAAYAEAAAAFEGLAGSSKMLLLKLARAATTGRPFDAAEPIATMESLWEDAMDVLAVPVP